MSSRFEDRFEEWLELHPLAYGMFLAVCFGAIGWLFYLVVLLFVPDPAACCGE